MPETTSTRVAQLRQTPPNSSGKHRGVTVEHHSDCECPECVEYQSRLNAYDDAYREWEEAVDRGDEREEPEPPSQPTSVFCDTCQDPETMQMLNDDVTHTVAIKDCPHHQS